MKSFLSACGIADSLQLTIESPGAKEADLRLLPQPFAVIGRDLRADVVLDHHQVSRRHVYLQVIEGRAFWVDLESRTGTRGGGGPQKHGWLVGGRTLGLGPFVIQRLVNEARHEDSQPEHPTWDTPMAALTYGREPLLDVALEFLNGPSRSMIWPMHRVMSLIGSAKSCKFRLTDASVSAFHVSLLRTPVGLWVVDLRGGNSITLNDVPVRASEVVDGDVLGIGRYRIRMRCRLREQARENSLPDRGQLGSRRRLARQGRTTSNSLALRKPAGSSSFLPVPPAPMVPSTEILPTGAAFPVKLEQPELTESVLVPLVNQFSLMQQQMFDQFQQAMGMLVEMFSTMHREQMEVIREELDRLHQLSDELQSLKDELANRSHQGASLEAVPEQRPSAAASLDAVTAGAATGTAAAGLVAAPAPAARPATMAVEVPSATGSPQSAAAHVLSHRPLRKAGASPALAESGGLATPVPQQSQPGRDAQAKAASTTGLADSDRNAVVWLHQRIMTLQKERESRWQKILKLLPGVS
jgi:pSer/pThr/pTyr-binding forkhead associated (FHA) protein